MTELGARPEVRLRVLVADDAGWLVELDRAAATSFARVRDWDRARLADELEGGQWAADDRWGWAILVDGEPVGFALITDLDQRDARMDLRIAPSERGRGVGREVLRQLADHHFAAEDGLLRLAGRTHEHNVPMQRAFNAAGFRMEARYRDTYVEEGGAAAEWGYALTRADWRAGRHRADAPGFDLHGLSFEIEETAEGPEVRDLLVRFLQEGRRAIARYDAAELWDGELAGLLVADVLRYRFVHLTEEQDGPREVTGSGEARVQRRGDNRLEMVDSWIEDAPGDADAADARAHGRRVLLERRTSTQRP